MNIRRYILIALIAIILVVTIITLANPLRKSEEKIREDLLELMPVGTSMKETMQVTTSKEWELEWVDDDSGYLVTATGIPVEGAHSNIGEKSMKICMGKYNYRILFPVYVIAYFGFDKDSKLVDISVTKYIDTL